MDLFLTLDDIELKGQNVMLRLDLNMPWDGDQIRDTTRLDTALETLKKLRDSGAHTAIVTHMGRPQGADPKLSTEKLLPLLESKIKAKIRFEKSVDDLGQSLSDIGDGEFVLLENIRFNKEEEQNDEDFSKRLSKPFNIYVNEAFSVSHRAHSSVHGAVAHIPLKIAGYNFKKELEYLSSVFDPENRPVVAIVAGAKVSTKMKVLDNLFKICDFIIIGGAMANTFLVATGALKEGSSLYEPDFVEEARNIVNRNFHKIILPRDAVCADDIDNPKQILTVDIVNVPKTYKVADIGPKSIARMKEICEGVKTIIWNGPMGVFEKKPFDSGSLEVAKMLSELTTSKNITTIAGGGDTLASMGSYKDQISYVSTAGGAFLEWLEGGDLPGVKILYRHFRAS